MEKEGDLPDCDKLPKVREILSYIYSIDRIQLSRSTFGCRYGDHDHGGGPHGITHIRRKNKLQSRWLVAFLPFDRMPRILIISESAIFSSSDRVKIRSNVRSGCGPEGHKTSSVKRKKEKLLVLLFAKRKQILLLFLLFLYPFN